MANKKPEKNILDSELEDVYDLDLIFTIICDWHQICTPEKFKKDFPSFKFKGPGWYISKGDYLFVTKCPFSGDKPTGKIPDPENSYCFSIFNGRNPIPNLIKTLTYALSAPIRTDDR